MNRRFKPVTKELVISFGFVNGFWFGIGIDPQKIILTFIGKYIGMTPIIIQRIFTIIPIILTIITLFTIIKIYKSGGIFGGIAVLIAFIAGIILLKNWQASIMLGLVAILLGLITFRE